MKILKHQERKSLKPPQVDSLTRIVDTSAIPAAQKYPIIFQEVKGYHFNDPFGAVAIGTSVAVREFDFHLGKIVSDLCVSSENLLFTYVNLYI